MISGTIIASAMSKLFLHIFLHLVVKKLTLDKTQERHYSPHNFHNKEFLGVFDNHTLGENHETK